MHICLFEDELVHHLAPLSLTRHAADLRLGMLTVAELHEALLRPTTLQLTGRPEISAVTAQEHPLVEGPPAHEGILFTNARWVPERGELVDQLIDMAAERAPAAAVVQHGVVLAAWQPNPPENWNVEGYSIAESLLELPTIEVEGERLLARLWDLVDDVEGRLTADFKILEGGGRHSGDPSAHATIVGSDVHIGENVRLLPGAVINALDGPVWIGDSAVVEENAVVRGPCYVGPRAQVKAAARIDGSAIGPVCKAGGEVHASVMHSYSSKGHDGYLGNSYLGRWCNLGADTNTSNLKNDYGEVTMFDAVEGDFVATGQQFLGLVMGDHSKCSINTMFNTGTVVGVFCNLFGSDFPPRHIPDFSWGGAAGLSEYRLEKALRVAEAVMARRDIPLSGADRELLGRISERAR